MNLTIDFWGVRGSLPFAPSPTEIAAERRSYMLRFFKQGNTSIKDIDPYMNSVGVSSLGGFGTATTCVQVSSKLQTIIIDAGTGIKLLGDQIISGPTGNGQEKINIFLTHFHWDHLIGLPAFKPAMVKGNQIHFYAVEPDLEYLIRNYLSHPWVKNDLNQWKAEVHFHVLEARQTLQIEDLTITPYKMDHPDPCWGYRISSGGKNYAHCADTEATRITQLSLGSDLPMYQNVDLMYFDAQYTLGELSDRINWGHSAAQIGLDLAFREKIKHVLFSHHDPISTASTINLLAQQTQEYYQWKIDQAEKQNKSIGTVEWGFVFEGQRVEL